MPGEQEAVTDEVLATVGNPLIAGDVIGTGVGVGVGVGEFTGFGVTAGWPYLGV